MREQAEQTARIPQEAARWPLREQRVQVKTRSTMSLTMASNCCAASCKDGISSEGSGGLELAEASSMTETGVFCAATGPLTKDPSDGPADESDIGPGIWACIEEELEA